MTISLSSWEGAAIGLAAARLGLTTKTAADSFPAGILNPSSAMIARWALPFPPWQVGNLHYGSPAQCSRAPERMHLDLA